MEKALRVLIVDDEERLARSIARLLSARGIKAQAVFSGEQAVETFRAGKTFDVVVLDVKMPGMDGVQTLKAIKGLAPAAEVIMLTGHASLDSGTQAMRCGAFDYLMENPGLFPEIPLQTVMQPVSTPTAPAEEQLTDTAHRMIQHKVRCMPVVENGKVIGIIRLQDIFRFVEHETE